MINNNSDLYQIVRELCRILSERGSVSLSNKLSDALSISSLPGEVLGDIGLALKCIINEPVCTDTEISNRVEDIQLYLSRAIGYELCE